VSFFETNLDYVYFLAGLAFVSLGVVAMTLTLERERAARWWLLGVFGAGHGAALWASVMAVDLGDTATFAWLRLGVCTLGALALLEFGRDAVAADHPRMPGRWLTALAAVAVALSSIGGITFADVATRWALALPAGLLAALALARRAYSERLEGRTRAAGALAVLAGSLAGYALLWVARGCGVVHADRSMAETLAGVPILAIVGLAAAGAGVALLAYSAERYVIRGDIRDRRAAYARFYIVAAMLAIALIGGYLVTEATSLADTTARVTLLQRAYTAAAAVDVEHTDALNGRPSDAADPDYAQILGELERIHAVNDDVRYMYLVRDVGGRATFLADSAAMGPVGVSRPGDVYREASPGLRAILAGRRTGFVEGPLTDRWGTWITAFAPVHGEGGELIGVLGMDIPVTTWAAATDGYRATAIALIIVASALAMGFFAAFQMSRDGARRIALSESRFRAILASAPEGIAIVDPADARITFANQQFADMVGLPLDDLTGATMDDFFIGGIGDGPTTAECPVYGERMLRTSDGGAVDVEITCNAIELEDRPLRLAYLHDVSSAKAAERDLQDRIMLENTIRGVSGRFLSSDASDVPLVVGEALAGLGTALDVDRAYLATCRAGVCARTHEWCAPGVPPLREQMQRIEMDGFPWFYGHLAAGEPVHIPSLDTLPPEAAAERAILGSQGVTSRIAVPLTESGRLTGYLVLDTVGQRREWSDERVALLTVFADVVSVATRRAKAETELAKLTLAVTNSPAAVVITNAEGSIEYVNPRFRELSGYDMAELLGRNPRVLKSGAIDPSVYAELWRVITSGGDWRGELVNQRKDGTHYTVQASISPVRDSSGDIHYVCVQEDITPLKIAEEALREAAATAEAANHAKSDFLATMSHEIRTPMNAIIGMAELLDETELTPEQGRYVRIFRSAGEALLTLINDVLDLSKIEAGHFDIDRRAFEIEQLVEETAEILAHRAREKGVDLMVDIDPGTPREMHGDPDRVRQVLVNLVGNALKFTEHGHVIVTVAPVVADSAPSVRFAVEDTGIGIPTDKLEAIFEAFTQADSSTTRTYGGTGLGLTISRRLVELMGGRLAATSEVGAGSTFAFVLPLAEAEAGDAVGAGSSEPLAGVRALIIDDSPTNLLIVRRYLEQAGATVAEAAEAASGIARLRSGDERFDVVVTDLRMPELSGFDVTEAVVGDPRTAKIPVLIVSSDARAGDPQRAADAGAAGLLVKPIRRRVLVEAVAAACSRSRGTATPFVSTDEPPVIAGQPSVDTTSRAMDVLLVEDTEDSRMLALAYMKGTQHRIVTAENGTEAVAAFVRAGAGGFDLVFMDMQMPVMDGYAATKRIREIEAASHWPRTSIVALTAYALAQETSKALDAGCDDYLTKPIKKATLLATLAKFAGE